MVSPNPSTDNTRLDIPKHEKRNPHDTDTPVKRQHDLIHKEIGNEGDEPANKVPDCKRDGRNPRLVTVGFGFLVVECDEELEKPVRGGVERDIDFGDGFVGQAVFGECGVDD